MLYWIRSTNLTISPYFYLPIHCTYPWRTTVYHWVITVTKLRPLASWDSRAPHAILCAINFFRNISPTRQNIRLKHQGDLSKDIWSFRVSIKCRSFNIFSARHYHFANKGKFTREMAMFSFWENLMLKFLYWIDLLFIFII